jgi:hypothetical protein
MTFRNVIALLFAGLLASCSAPQTRQLDSQSHGLESQQQLLAVPYFPQTPYQCGPAALASALNYRGVPVTPEQLIDQVFIPARQGSLPLEMTAAARQGSLPLEMTAVVRSEALLPYPVDHYIRVLLEEIEAGNPILVMQNLGFDWWPQWHYAIVIGFDLVEQDFILHSGTQKNYRIPFSTFERTWSRADYWGLVIVKPGQIPASARELTYLRTVHDMGLLNPDLDPTPMYQAAHQRWPSSPLPLLSSANSDYRRGNIDRAMNFLQQLLRDHPTNSQAWNNLAYVARDKQCYQLAFKAARTASKLAPQNSAIAATLDEMADLPSIVDSKHCVTVSP